MTGILPATPVINEIHYNNDVNYIANEFVEIYNPGPDLVNLSGWQLTGGVEFTFPPNTLLGANNYVAVAENPTTLRAEFSSPPNGPPLDLPILGPCWSRGSRIPAYVVFQNEIYDIGAKILLLQ